MAKISIKRRNESERADGCAPLYAVLNIEREKMAHSNKRRIVINLCLSIEIAEAEDEKFGVVDAVEFSPERLDFGID